MLCFQKRVDMYTATVDTYLNYFQKTNRLITVDVACGEADIIWNSVNKLMADLDFHAKRSINTVVVFTFGKQSITDACCNVTCTVINEIFHIYL